MGTLRTADGATEGKHDDAAGGSAVLVRVQRRGFCASILVAGVATEPDTAAHALADRRAGGGVHKFFRGPAAVDDDKETGPDEWEQLTAAGRKQKLEHGRIPLGVLKSQFVSFYGADYYENRRLWDTWDGVIPWQLFYARLVDMHSVLVLHRVNMAQAVSQANALTSGERRAMDVARDLLRKWVKLAFPKHRKREEEQDTDDGG
jgi:hypothetical protein